MHRWPWCAKGPRLVKAATFLRPARPCSSGGRLSGLSLEWEPPALLKGGLSFAGEKLEVFSTFLPDAGV